MTVALQAQTFTKDQCVTGLRVAVGILEKWHASSDQASRILKRGSHITVVVEPRETKGA